MTLELLCCEAKVSGDGVGPKDLTIQANDKRDRAQAEALHAARDRVRRLARRIGPLA